MKDFDIFSELSDFRGEIDFMSKLKEKKAKEQELKKLKPSERLLLEIKEKGFDLSQMESVLKTRGNQLIISCAGSGKTTSLTFKIIYDLKTGWATKVMDVNGNKIRVPDKIWVCTFLKSGADELEYSLRKWQNQLHCADTSKSIQFSTLHAEFLRALKDMGKSVDIISAKENSNLLKDVLKPYQLLNGKGKPLNSEDMSNLESALTRTRNVLDPSRYDSDIYDELNISPTLIDSILFDWLSARKKVGKYDFEDLQETLYTECYRRNNQEVIDFLSKRYNFIYVDEFQDTSQIQYKLIQIYAMNSKQIVAIGDDDQTIYSWRGSDNHIITEEFSKDFNPVVNPLSINFRCPKNILNSIKPSIEKNSIRFKKDLESAQDGGKVRVAPMPSYTAMVSMLSDCIYNDVKNGRSVAILCRTNSDGLMPALILDKINNFSFSISGDGMTLNSYIGRTVLSIIKLFTEGNTQPVKSALEMLTWDKYEVNNLIRVCKSNKLTIWDVDAKDLSYSCPSISSKLLTWRSWREKMGDIQALKLVLQDYRMNVFDKDTQFNTVIRSVISSIEALLDYFNYDYVEDFLYELDDINERLQGRRKKKGVKVQIATVHEFKGKEADSVYVWNDSEDVFPQKNAQNSEEEIEEERRVHYIACTRAKQISTLIYLKNKAGMFVSEMDLTGADVMSNDTGVVMGVLKKEAEANKNLSEFEKVADSERKDEVKTEKLDLDTQNYVKGLVPYFEDNEFWGMDGDEGE